MIIIEQTYGEGYTITGTRKSLEELSSMIDHMLTRPDPTSSGLVMDVQDESGNWYTISLFLEEEAQVKE